MRPPAKLGEYKGLEVGRAEPEPDPEIVEREVERIRGAFARLEPVERAAAEGDVVLIDFEGLVDGKAFEGGKATDYTLELGSGQLIEGFEEQLAGASAGRGSARWRSPSPRTTRRSSWPAKTPSSTVEVKEVREKVLPELDDDFASEASEFDTLEELRADIGERVGEARRRAGRAGLPRRRGRRRRRCGDGRAARRPRHRAGGGAPGSASNASSPPAA